MNQLARPSITPLVFSQLIDAAPGRVRKRLDKEPDAAKAWAWQASDDGWLVECGEESVALKPTAGVIDSLEAVSCSCLLSPRCFHILACVTSLNHADQDERETEDEPPSSNVEPDDSNLVDLDESMRAAASRVRDELGLLVRIGGRRADLLRQSGLLRAAHGCRAAGLVSLGNLVLRVVESIRRQRDGADTADSHALAEGIALALQQCEVLSKHPQVSRAIIGQVRRQFERCDVGRLMGICAEPVLTLSGYAGVVVHFQATDVSRRKTPNAWNTANDRNTANELYTVNELRPGDSQWIAQAYRGGIDMGNQTLQAAEVCRSQLFVQNLTASADGRLGKGACTRWVVTKRPDEMVPFSSGRFGSPLADQIAAIFRTAAAGESLRIAGWDLLAFHAQVVGAHGSTLVVRLPELESPWKMRIAIDSPAIPFRQNLSLLARCPGLILRCLGRIRFSAAGEIDLLAIASGCEDRWSKEAETDEPRPKLNLPKEWRGLCNVGCDRLERWHIDGVRRWSEEVTLATEPNYSRGEFEGSPLDGLEPLRRRQVSIALGGRQGIASAASDAHRRDRGQLLSRHQHTAAELLECLAVAAEEREIGPSAIGTQRGIDRITLEHVYLANHIYLRTASLRFQQQIWMQGFD